MAEFTEAELGCLGRKLAEAADNEVTVTPEDVAALAAAGLSMSDVATAKVEDGKFLVLTNRNRSHAVRVRYVRSTITTLGITLLLVLAMVNSAGAASFGLRHLRVAQGEAEEMVKVLELIDTTGSEVEWSQPSCEGLD